ncbi:RusA family crossover junction endodeoxyribonuclease [Paenibacillus sp. HJGM_3]|uniref:RusA family crossover junction endodeoxyribonuclease n=1 Tax=Paenibacillus sp. HJGM_3 TaxID=3379816 RepID=UPI003858F3A7
MSNYIEIAPRGAVRMTQKGKFMDKSAMAYLSYKNEIGYKLREMYPEPMKTPVAVNMTFWMPIPSSGSKRQQFEMNGRPHQKRPDIDNLIKGFFDAANKIVWQDDNLVVKCTAQKRYAEQPGIEFEIEEVAG